MSQTIRIAGTISESIVDGPGMRYVIFTQGCPHGCPGCHNPETHDFNGGTEMTTEALLADIEKNRFIKAVTFSGGDPLSQPAPLAEIAQTLKKRGYHLMAYTGFTFEALMASEDPAVHDLLAQLDLLVDGPFILAKRNIDLRFRGSANQRILDVPASLAAQEAVWCEKYR